MSSYIANNLFGPSIPAQLHAEPSCRPVSPFNTAPAGKTYPRASIPSRAITRIRELAARIIDIVAPGPLRARREFGKHLHNFDQHLANFLGVISLDEKSTITPSFASLQAYDLHNCAQKFHKFSQEMLLPHNNNQNEKEISVWLKAFSTRVDRHLYYMTDKEREQLSQGIQQLKDTSKNDRVSQDLVNSALFLCIEKRLQHITIMYTRTDGRAAVPSEPKSNALTAA